MRFYVSPDSIFPEKNLIKIKDKAELHHIRDVMRLQKGAIINVFDGKCREFLGAIEEINKDLIIIKILDINSVVGEGFKPSPAITLYQAIPKKSKMDLIVEKTIELGVDHIVPIITERTVPDARDFTKKAERWRRIGMASSKQCGRRRLAAISDVMDFDSALIDSRQNDLVIFASLDKGSMPLKDILRGSAPKTIAVFIGPEGDFSPREISMAKETGCSLCSLGSLVLKSETAAIYMLSCLSYESQ